MSLPTSINGLANIGNTCYLNATLQCLIHSSLFIEYLVKNQKSVQNSVQNLNIINMILDLHTKQLGFPVLLKRYLASLNMDLFNNNIQQDSHECLVSILDLLHEETRKIEIDKLRNNIFKTRLTNTEHIKSIDTWRSYEKVFGYSFINHIFSGQLVSILYCTECSKESYVFDIFNEIQLSMISQKSVQDFRECCSINSCLLDYMITEDITEKDCEFCKKKTNQKRKLTLWDLPNTLIINLKRYSNGNRNNKEIFIDNELSFEHGNTSFKYKLTCIVHHSGLSQNSGHYVTEICKGDKWYLADDDKITEHVHSDISRTAYILSYQLQ